MHTVSGAKDGRKRFPFSRIKDQLVVLAVKSEVAYLFFDAHFFRFHPYSPWRSQPQPNFHLP